MRSRWCGGILAATATLAMAGCAGDTPAPPATVVTTVTQTVAPSFDPQRGAAGNLDPFRQAIERASRDVTEQRLRDEVAAAGFRDWSVEASGDGTTLDGVKADFHQIAVLGPDKNCLIGQVGKDGQVRVLVAKPMAATGKCFIGTTS